MTAIHPDLAPLAAVAKAFSGALRTAGKTNEPELSAALRGAVGKRSGWFLPQHRVGDPAHYMRHLVYADPDGDFVIAAIAWLPGQQSAVHGHHVWCAYGAIEGELVEETFRASGAALEHLGARVIRAGELSDIDLGGPLYHRVSNRAQQLLVTLHVYGIAADRMSVGVNRLYDAQ